MDIKRQGNEMRANQIIKQLRRRGMEGYYCKSIEASQKCILSLIPQTDQIGWGGSRTLEQIGIRELLRERGNPMIERNADMPVELKRQRMREALLSGTFLMSTNAITLQGELVNIDGIGNRVAALCFGPRQVVVVAGMNKVVTDIECAVKRLHAVACAENSIRYGSKTPCAHTGLCSDCLENSLCGQIVVTRLTQVPNRIKVVLIDAELGF